MTIEKPKKYCQITHSDHEGQRIDNYLISYYNGVPKARVYRAIRKGEVRINGKRIKQTYRIQAGDEIRLPPLKTSEKQTKNILSKDLDLSWLKEAVLFEDEDLIVINKPSGLAVHGGTGVNLSLIDYLKHLYPNQYFKLVHRLDQGTSGCLLIAKNRAALLYLQQQFKDRTISKSYKALCVGQLKQSPVEIKTHLVKDRDGETGVKMRIDKAGKEAISIFQAQVQGKHVSLLHIDIKTGRMHQIRVQAQKLGVPIIGDDKYGDQAVNKYLKKHGIKHLHLSCTELTFEHNKERLTITAPNPKWVNELDRIDKLLTKN